MRLFDCTLRDGANVVGNGFSKELTISVIDALLACGIPDIEFGNAKGIGAYEALKSVAPLTDLEYMQLASVYANKGRLGMFALAKLADETRVRQAADSGLHFLRIGADAGDGSAALAAIKRTKNAGLICRYSLMKAYILTAAELAQEAAILADEGVDIITIMDSAGTMLPDTVNEYVAALKATVTIPVGFHGHNNLGLSQANALAAIQANADEIDCGLLGMARNVGNCSTELTVALLQRLGLLKGIDFYKLLEYLQNDLIPAMYAYGFHPTIQPVDLVMGVAGCHSQFLPLFEHIVAKENAPLFQLIIDVSREDAKSPSEELILKSAKNYK